MTTSLTGREIEDSFRGKVDLVKPYIVAAQFRSELKNLFVNPVKVTLSDIATYVQLIEREKGIKVGVVGIDYLQLVDAPGYNEYETVSRLARQTKEVAKQLDIPVVVLSQVSRKGVTVKWKFLSTWAGDREPSRRGLILFLVSGRFLKTKLIPKSPNTT